MNLPKVLAAIALLSVWVCRSAAQLTISETYDVNQLIPDGSLSGLADHQTIITSASQILDVTATLSISGIDSGAVNGDLYAYISHGTTGFVVLLNRPGRNAGNSVGYDDNGLSSVTFADSAVNGDVHEYRIKLFGDENTPISPAPSPLTGTWAPDGRNISPLSSGTVLAATPRSALLSSLNGLDPNGSWTLFVADVATG